MHFFSLLKRPAITNQRLLSCPSWFKLVELDSQIEHGQADINFSYFILKPSEIMKVMSGSVVV